MMDEPTTPPSCWTMDDATHVLLPKLLNVLRARGMPEPAPPSDESSSSYVSETALFQMEIELECPLPTDYKALIQALPPHTEWGLDPWYLFRPHEIQACVTELRGLSRDDVGVDVWWDNAPKHDRKPRFVPFGTSSSAFYVGWIVRHDPITDKHAWNVVQLDGENDLALEEGHEIPGNMTLVELLYRMVVRAVSPSVWQVYRHTAAAYFWHSEQEAKDLYRGSTQWPRDGSHDRTASSAETQIVVLGRPVVYLQPHQQYNDDDDDWDEDDDTNPVLKEIAEEQEDEGREEETDKEMHNTTTVSPSQLASLEDFTAMGDYNLTHPLDLQREAKRHEIHAARKTPAVVSLDDDNNKNSHPLVSVSTAACLAQRIAVGDRGAALITTTGHLAWTERAYDCRMWFCRPANQRLMPAERFVQVALGGSLGLALTNCGRLLQWDRRHFDEDNEENNMEESKNESTADDTSKSADDGFRWVSLSDNLTVVNIAAGARGAVAVDAEGKLWHWGNMATSPMPQPENRSENTPLRIPTTTPVAQVSMDGNAICVLHTDGRVSYDDGSRQNRKLVTGETTKTYFRPIEGLPRIVALREAGDHRLFVADNGTVYGMGNRSEGQLPLAVTHADLEAYEQAKQDFQRDLAVFETEIEAFRKNILDHAASFATTSATGSREQHEAFAVPSPLAMATNADVWSDSAATGNTAAVPPSPFFETVTDPLKDALRTARLKARTVNRVNGVWHTPDTTGAPPIPERLYREPVLPTPVFGTQPVDVTACPKSLETPTLLTVGPVHEESLARTTASAAEGRTITTTTTQKAWNSILGPYGLSPGSFATVVQVSGSFGHSVFLHCDGRVSACGGGIGLALGIGADEANKTTPTNNPHQDWDGDALPADESCEPAGASDGIVSCHVRTGGYLSVYDNLGIPTLVPGLEKVVCVSVNHGGGLAVTADGSVWSCGDHMGTDQPTATYELLHILTHEGDDSAPTSIDG